MNPYGRMTRAILSGTIIVIALTWAIYAVDRRAWPGVALPVGVTLLGVVNVVLTLLRPGLKVAAVRRLQRWVVNPLVRGLLRLGLNPLGVTLLETRGRRSGEARATPVGVARDGGRVWLVAEHGHRAGYVRNIAADPRVRLRLREAGRCRWVDGIAHLEPTDDPLARQRWMAGWNPVRWLNAAMVRFLGAELLSVRVELAGLSAPVYRAE
ncbi:nitroreductase/quinone reductase family protein [Arsenicicoccus bolidensis]|uniref:nitroreductase/quinone reductase family protein n=2 Tax=Arsenicicoccus TaxID=267408 RepID=UPI0028A61DEA|nr:nitroreductase/quinone reductase family protein [Arsenicicoccus bolidensis]